MLHRVAIVVFDGFQLLDASGPASVYGSANDALNGVFDTDVVPRAGQGYEVITVSSRGGPVRSSSGVEIVTTAIAQVAPSSLDSLFVIGGEDEGLRRAGEDPALRDWTRAAQHHVSRIGSICSGSLLLAHWGLIGARRFATHWDAVAHIRKRWPELALDAESIFVEDGSLWTSAGVTTGIDMTLALVERDHGPAIARAVAQRLVLSIRRPGWQSQFSPMLAAQGGRDGRYADLIAWIAGHLDQPMSVEALSERAGETLRSFHRNFTAATGSPPAQFVNRNRIARARALIEAGHPLKQVAGMTGYPNPARLSAAFQRELGLTASEYRMLHGPACKAATGSAAPVPAHC
ncbi:MAG: DJ-1/PfpI family protein [Sphingorhabdus sp.]|uniref:GlxA family transcriptional regulator n=1 Tax=Sphingorhabdus sp. TaxID=1902408 RepID=UPI003C9E5500